MVTHHTIRSVDALIVQLLFTQRVCFTGIKLTFPSAMVKLIKDQVTDCAVCQVHCVLKGVPYVQCVVMDIHATQISVDGIECFSRHIF